jgi:hypothetical protein
MKLQGTPATQIQVKQKGLQTVSTSVTVTTHSLSEQKPRKAQFALLLHSNDFFAS